MTKQPAVSVAPVILVIFGITGDLAQRKLLPALYHLLKDGLLHEDSVIIGITRRPVTSRELLSQVDLCAHEEDGVCDPEGLRRVTQALRMHQMSLTDDSEYQQLLQIMNDIEQERGICMDRLYYLSIPPQMFQPIVRGLGANGLSGSCQHGRAAARLLVEKPFGYDLASAQELIAETGEWFSEAQLFRIDHYVAKETVQNILTFRRANPLFTSIWNREHIADITITAYEQIDIEGRAVFYERIGALRDFIQSHLLQLLAIVTMELPADESSPAIHAAKQALLESVAPITSDQVATRAVRGQYRGYQDEVRDASSTTETYAAITVQIDTPRWQGVPITIRTGKAMSRKLTEIRIGFHGHDEAQAAPNELVFRIQPDEGIELRLNAKQPGYASELQAVGMDWSYSQGGHPDAYERVLVDAARGDHTLFTTSAEVVAAWRIVEDVLQVWSSSTTPPVAYDKGSESVG